MKNRTAATALVVSGLAFGAAAGIPDGSAMPRADLGYMAASYFTDNGAAINGVVSGGAAGGGLAAAWLGAKIGGKVGAVVGGPVGLIAGAAIGGA